MRGSRSTLGPAEVVSATVADVGEGAQDAHGGGEADPAGDGHGLVGVGGAGGVGAVGAVEPHLLALAQRGDPVGEVALVPDGQLEAAGHVGARGDRERVLLGADHRAAQAQPDELSGREAQATAAQVHGGEH